MKKIAIVDTTFARYDMAKAAIDELKSNETRIKIIRRTVPGIKDLAVACKQLLDEGCDAAMAFGMPGPDPKDKMSAQVASNALSTVQLQTNKYVLEVFVHEDEADSPKDLAALCDRRAREHVLNLMALLFYPRRLVKKAGTGQREGYPDVGPLRQ
jgi:riboflavin synthase